MKRLENKYFISLQSFYALKNIFNKILVLDNNCKNDKGYNVRTLYFDNFSNDELEKKINGDFFRSKLRLRVYNNNFSKIFLEVKDKENFLSKKNKILLNQKEAENFIKSKLPYQEYDNELINEIIQKKNNNFLVPKIIINYSRLAFKSRDGGTRITFDFNLNSESSSIDFFNTNKAKFPIISDKKIILEIKYKNFIPKYIGEIIETCNLNRCAISKYYLAFKYQNFINRSETILETF